MAQEWASLFPQHMRDQPQEIGLVLSLKENKFSREDTSPMIGISSQAWIRRDAHALALADAVDIPQEMTKEIDPSYAHLTEIGAEVYSYWVMVKRFIVWCTLRTQNAYGPLGFGKKNSFISISTISKSGMYDDSIVHVTWKFTQN